MTSKLLLAATMLAAATPWHTGVHADAARHTAPVVVTARMATIPAAPWAIDDPADSLYRQAREALNRGEYRDAARLFGRITSEFPRSEYAGDALYWSAFANYSIGEADALHAALDALEVQRTRYAGAATRGDANALTVRIRGALAKLGDVSSAQAVATRAGAAPAPCTSARRGDDDEDERVAALNALLQMNAEQALPVLRTVLARRDACSEQLRAKAVFLVSQARSAERETILLDVVSNDPSREVRKKAVFWLGQVHTDRAAEALERLLKTSGDEELRGEAVMALMEQQSERGVSAVRAVALDDKAPESVRGKAVFWLGQHRSPANATFLRDLFGKLAGERGDASQAVQKKILFSLSQMPGEGNDRWLLEIAADPKYSSEVRKQAIFGAGQAHVATADLIALYGKLTDREVKGQLIWVLSDRRDPAAADRLIEIAKHDPDPEMRKKAIFWLGQSHDPRVKQLLLDIINGE